jgi:predicted nucleic acid-binding protein
VPKFVALDTEVLVIASGGPTALERGKDRALQMINHHAGRGESIFVPAPAFAECCHSVESSLLSLLRVVPFDAPAALLANRLSLEIRRVADKPSPATRDVTRESLKVDAMILATAEVAGADIFYVGQDDWFAKVAEALYDTEHRLHVEVRELPAYEPQPQRLPIDDSGD